MRACGSIDGIVLAAFTLDAIGLNELRRNHARIQAQLTQLSTPEQEFLTLEHTVGDYLAGCIDCMDLDEALGQINANAGNVVQGKTSGKLNIPMVLGYGVKPKRERLKVA